MVSHLGRKGKKGKERGREDPGSTTALPGPHFLGGGNGCPRCCSRALGPAKEVLSGPQQLQPLLLAPTPPRVPKPFRQGKC